MKTFIIIAEALTAGAVLGYLIQDRFWHTPLGWFLISVILAAALFGAFLYGTNHGIRIGQKNHDVIYDIGFQSGKRWRG